MGMGTGEICRAINEIDGKKEKLRESLKRLLLVQSRSSSSVVVRNLKWEELDSYFKTLESSLHSKFNLLLLHTQSESAEEEEETATTRSAKELKGLCENSDGSGLKQYIISNNNSVSPSILVEAFTRYAPATAPALVLDSISSSDEFHPSSPLVIMLQALILFIQNHHQPPAAAAADEDKAMQIALQLRTRTCSSLGFLLLVKAYGLIHRFDDDDLIDSFFTLAQTHPSHAIHLCPQILSPNHIKDLIQKLIDKHMHTTAVSFSIQLHATDHFPPVRLLEERKLMSITAIEEARDNIGACNNEVMPREINMLKAIVKCVDENHLQSEYPKDSVVELVNKLENEVENAKQDLVKKLKNDPGSKKRSAIAPVSKKKPSSRSKKPKQNKILETAKLQNVMPVEESHSQQSDLLPGHIDQYHSSSCGSDPTAPYTGPFASPCELARANSGHSGNLMPVDDGTGFFVSQSHLPSSCNSNGWISE